MKIVFFGAMSLIVLGAFIGFWLQSVGVLFEAHFGVPTFLSFLSFPVFGGIITFLMAWVNRKTIARLWDNNRIEKSDMRPAIVILFGPLLALLLQVYVGLEHFELTTKARMIFGFTIVQLGFFILMGNYAATLRPGSPGGFRTPWTLKSSTVWAKTHRLLGRGLVMVSLGGLISVMTIEAKSILFGHLAVVILLKAFAYVYSYVTWRAEMHSHPT